MDKLGVQIGELRQVYTLTIGREATLSERLMEVFAVNGETKRVDFWSFLTAIPLIMANNY